MAVDIDAHSTHRLLGWFRPLRAPGVHSAWRNASHARWQCDIAPQGDRCIDGAQSNTFLWGKSGFNFQLLDIAVLKLLQPSFCVQIIYQDCCDLAGSRMRGSA